MNKTNLGKSFYTESAPSVIRKELHREFHLPYAEVTEGISEIPDLNLVTAIIVCYEKDSEAVLDFLQRFNAER